MATERPALTVTQFVELVNAHLDALPPVVVEGEIIEYKVIQNKWVVFDLKDSESVVKCFMTVWQARTPLEDGMLVRVVGHPKLRPRGFFSFVLDSVQPAGEGSLKRAFELLKQKLESEGLFAAERKRMLPRYPEHIALITSRDAAAYSDFLKVLKGRLGGLTISFIHTAVQGEEAPHQIIAALAQANTLPDIDAIVLVRGGGSMEDLQAFNDELVVRAVATSRVPTVVGIGHERDVSLAELAADQRASTPSNAAELLVRTRAEIQAELVAYQAQLATLVRQAIQGRQNQIVRAVATMRTQIAQPRERILHTIQQLAGQQHRLKQTIVVTAQRLTTHERHLGQQMHNRFSTVEQRLSQLVRLLHSFSPEKTLKRGYSITRTKDGQVIKHAAALKAGAVLLTQLADGQVASRVAPDAANQLELKL